MVKRKSGKNENRYWKKYEWKNGDYLRRKEEGDIDNNGKNWRLGSDDFGWK